MWFYFACPSVEIIFYNLSQIKSNKAVLALYRQILLATLVHVRLDTISRIVQLRHVLHLLV